ncbi:class I SAM-dependent methyltransferase [Allochromatium vinosum]|uniref:class I SAM-dependent methyltransferase n=1 Tax=Allochromatium vinosum TaxID=1049 RepID=UPI001903B145|nr:class I SAM-dependent methyltransferase [Allochromatium vinosum]MBK1656073.1 methyltransferase type 12 [Allochromatium vinosum]
MSRFEAVNAQDVRSYWNSRPCNIRHSRALVGTRQYFDEVEQRKYCVENHIPSFAEFERWRGKQVLEIGCGIGTDTMNFARAGARVTAVDISEESIAVAKQRAALLGLNNITFYHADAEALSATVPLKNFDLIYSFGVIHHTPHPERAIAEIRKYMGSDSVLKMMVYHRWSWKVFWILATYGRFAFWDLERLVARHSEAQTGCPVTYCYSRSSVAKLLHGFDISRADIHHIFPYRIQDYVNYRYVKVWYFRILPEPLFRWLERRFGWHLCVTAHLHKAA